MRIKVLYSSSYSLLQLESSLIQALTSEGFTYHSSGYDPLTLTHIVYFDYPLRKEPLDANDSSPG